jgi:putative peptidoglycan lipid II flippase
MKKTAIILILLSLLSKPLGFIKQLLLSYFFGATNLTDAYFIASSALGLMMIYFGAISTSYVPTYNKVLKSNGEIQAYKFTNNLISIQLILAMFVMIIICSFADNIIYLLASGLDDKTTALAGSLLIVLSTGIPFIVLTGELSSFLNIKNRSIQRALAQYTGHIFIFFVILAGIYSIYFLAIGSVVSVVIFTLLLVYLCYKQGLYLRLQISFDENVRYALVFALPMILNSSIALINVIVDQNIGSWLGEGVISAINYSASIQSLLMDGIIGIIMINVVFPRLSYLSVNNTHEAVISFRKILIILQCIVIPISFLFIFFATDIVSFIYQRGAFDNNAVNMTATVISTMAIAFPFMIYNIICNNMLFANHLSKWPLIVSIVAILTNIVLSLILSHFYGLVGLISGSVIASIFAAITSSIIFKCKIASLGLYTFLVKIFKIILVCIIVLCLTLTLKSYLLEYLSQNLAVIIYIIFASVSYLFLIQFVQLEEISIIRKAFIGVIKNKIS